jgi:hypothetical protein
VAGLVIVIEVAVVNEVSVTVPLVLTHCTLAAVVGVAGVKFTWKLTVPDAVVGPVGTIPKA